MIQKQTVYLPVKVEDDATFLITKEIREYLNINSSITFYKDGKCIYKPCFITETTKESEELEHLITHRLDAKNGYFFNKEQLNEYTKNIIKQALKIAAENAFAYGEGSNLSTKNNSLKWFFAGHIGDVKIDKQSILNQFNNIFEKLKV